MAARRRATVAALAPFAHCSAAEVRQIARWGDEVAADAGTLLLREGRIGYWFLVIIEGTVHLTRKGRTVGTLGPGDHVGEIAILGFSPQPATAVAVTPVRAFVLGRRELLSLVHLPSIQRGLCPDVAPAEFRAHVARLRREGDTAWRALAGRGHPRPDREVMPAGFRVIAPRRTFGAAVFALPLSRPTAAGPATRPGAPRVRPSTRAIAASAVVAFVAAGVAAHLYQPPVVLLSPGQVYDAVDDITVEGATSHAPSGRYLLVTVDAERPSLLGLAWAVIARDDVTVLRMDGGPHLDREAEHRRGRAAFQAAAHAAIEIVAATGDDGAPAQVTIRDRPLTGPSAGLVYALALTDLLDPVDRSQGRTIVATGAIDVEGRVLPVGHVGLKAVAARQSLADLFLVPRGQLDDAVRTPAAEVETLADALWLVATS